MSSIPANNPQGTGTGPSTERLVVPDSLTRQLGEFRRRVWSTKMLEALVFAFAGLLLAYLTVYVIDRFVDTPQWIRGLLFIAALAFWTALPWALHRWVWRNRNLEQTARLLRVREPVVGDQLLSVIELAGNESEQARSRSLCAAAIAQVADVAKTRNFAQAAPPTYVTPLSYIVALASITTLALAWLFPDAASNAWERFSQPWDATPRYTFTAFEGVPDRIVVPHGEVVPFRAALNETTQWRPEQATLQFGNLPALATSLEESTYEFELPAQVAPATMLLRAGDFYQSVTVEPKQRPELVSASAKVTLPSYLQRTESFEQDIRSGTLSVVAGSSAVVTAVASRDIAQAAINNTQVPVNEAEFQSRELIVDEGLDHLSLSWLDFDGLAGREPFELSIVPLDDEAPSVVSQDLERQAVILDSEQLNFMALAGDDFGIKRIGISWRSVDERLVEPIEGEKVIAAGSPESTSMQVPATFSAASLGIPAQPIEVRLWVEDYLAERGRAYSAPHLFYILTAEQHAIWITSQMSKWHRAALDVRDTELQLHEANKRLRAMSEEELSADGMQSELQRQAALESSNAKRLEALSNQGEDLLRQAARNPEVGVGHLDSWAEMLQVLSDIGTNRMPTVSDLLAKAASEKGQPGSSSKKATGPQAGISRATASSSGGEQSEENEQADPDAPTMPKIVDMESSTQPMEDNGEEEAQKKAKSKGGSRLSLPSTTLAGPPPPAGQEPPPPPEEDEEAIDEALFEQEQLLAEFEKVADEMNTILANLEGSTLMKRLKAASREQDQVAQKISSRIDAVFGRARKISSEDQLLLAELGEVEEQSSQAISYIMDDMQSYFERRRMNQFKLVLDDMKESDVLVALQNLGEEIPVEQGMSIAQAEYWSDSLDRWAEDLVDPAGGGQCPGSKNSDALPPSLILEVLKILESEVNLREETRVAEQARAAQEPEAFETEAIRLSETQNEIRSRTDVVVASIELLPEGAARFEKEIGLLSDVSRVMVDAKQILASQETGSPAIAAETEAIELLLQCKRINPKGGGGAGTNPGGGGTGTTQDSALALLGSGLNQNERREQREVNQATGDTGSAFPEEYRAGLDAYFNLLENDSN